MSLDYAFSALTYPLSSGFRATFSLGANGDNLYQFVPNGANSLLVSRAGGTNGARIHRFNPETVSGFGIAGAFTVASTTAINDAFVFLNGDGSNGYIILADGNNLRFWRGVNLNTNAANLTAASANATFATASASANLGFHQVSSTEAYLVAADSAGVKFWRFNPSTVSGAIASPTATFTGASSSSRVVFVPDDANSLIISSTTANTQLSGKIWRFNPATINANVTTETASLNSLSSGDTGLNEIAHVRIEGADYVALGRTGSSTPITNYIWGFNGASVSSTVPPLGQVSLPSSSSRLRLLALPGGDVLFLNAGLYSGVRSVVTRRLYLSSGPFRLDPYIELIQNTNNSSILASIVGNRFYVFHAFVAGDRYVEFADVTLNERTALISLVADTVISGSSPLRKTASTSLTLFNSIDYFLFSMIGRIGAQITASGLGATAYNFAFTANTNTSSTITENFALDGTADITGDYRITINDADLRLGTKTSYSSSFTLTGTARLVLNRSVEISSAFILSSGTQVVADNGTGPYTLTIPYGNPGLVLGAGITLAAPVVSYVRAVTGVPLGASVLLARRSALGIADRSQFTLASGNNSGNSTLVISGSIPADTPSSGFVRALRDNGNEDRIAYTSWSGSTFTLSGTLPATYSSGDGCYVGYLDTINAAASTISTSLQYVTTRDVVLRVRLGSGSSKIKDFTQNFTLGAQDSSIPAVVINDEVSNR